ncbi:MAG: hypothetical protein FD165_1592 [Gammaproteobacteria bacterium]|nr:MAG: hypothetical protein FD165_1592 [Gammaproteobacteria bacterium]TND05504.1 MAG: hypothetical protein FD120_1112 [Gammaproteobacteria bacterium]
MTSGMNRTRILDWIEHTGNRLPAPATLFFIGATLIMVLSQLAMDLGWAVDKIVVQDVDGKRLQVVQTVTAVGMLNSDGLWWLLSHMVSNFMAFPPLGIVLVGMLGIGIAEHSGFINALIKRGMRSTPRVLMTPAIVFIGIISSLTLDAGYVVLPPLAAALYYAVGRPPLAGLAAAFAGVSAGFGANLFITALDPLLAGLTEAAAQLVDTGYRVAVTANWWFMIASTLLLTLAGWFVTSRIVEPRLLRDHSPATTASPIASIHDPAAGNERRGLIAGIAAGGVTLLVVAVLVLVPGAPLQGEGQRFSRWIEAVVPLLFLVFLIPGVAYGVGAGTIRNDRDIARMMGQTVAGLGSYIVLAFFAAQFIELFKVSRLGEMLAITGGQMLSSADLGIMPLIGAFILVTLTGNLFIGSSSAKYALFAPVFVPMFMQVGISPELTQAAYRIGDSVSNVITPLNPYIIIVLAFMQRYLPTGGIGTLVALMLPYTIVFTLLWSALLLLWIGLGIALGPAGPLTYLPGVVPG